MTLRALSVRHPWAWAILHAGKDIENRTWRTDHRGPLVIHAGSATAPGARQRLAAMGITVPGNLVPGAIVGVVDVVDCVRDHSSTWAVPDHWHWVLTNPRPLAEPIVCKGALSLWRVPEEITRQLPTDLLESA
ncbi:ASCH domain-containing protein [Nocardiopsis tropica]|uniref:hypothetical protein n=1 Tax=Nocardiopsis tropica TaxID=109330 RepID=UPI002E8306D8|nr:ASCH domain-containing protein [Nocardiopsis tropica]